MQVSGMVHGATFISNLQATLAHSEVHSVHVYLSWERFFLGSFSHISLLILVNRNFYFDFLFSSLSNRFNEPRKSWMTIDSFVNNKLRLGELIDTTEVSFILIYEILSFLVISKVNMVFSTKHTGIWHTNNLEPFRLEEII